MTSGEVRFMESFKSGELVVEPGTPLLMEGSNSPQLFTVLDGLGLRFKTLENGRRQVVSFVFPGDFLGLQAGVMGEMMHSVEATTEMTLCVFDRSALWTLFRNHPERAYDVTWLAAVEEHFLGESLISLGQRSAEGRLCWALMRIHERLCDLGFDLEPGVPFPFRQQDLADALGLSLVHTNKTLARLRKQQLVSWQDGVLTIMNPARMAELSQIAGEPLPKRPLL